MKKSEMIQIVQDLLKQKEDAFGEISNWPELSVEIVTLIEQAGMLPPTYSERVENSANLPYNRYWNKWEEE